MNNAIFLNFDVYPVQGKFKNRKEEVGDSTGINCIEETTLDHFLPLAQFLVSGYY